MPDTPLPILAYNRITPANARYPLDHAALRAAIALIVLLVFWRTTSFGLTGWDDAQNIAGNELLRSPTQENLQKLWSEPQFGLYVPVTYTAWWLTMRTLPNLTSPDMGKMSWRFHLLNVLAHAAAAVLVFDLLRVLLRRAQPAAATACAFFGALLFALHPVQVESVAWVSGLKDLLGGAFSVAALLLYVSADKSATAYPLRMLGVVIFGAAAMLSKPVAVMLPVATYLIDVFWLNESSRGALLRSLPLLICSVVVAVITFNVQYTVQVPAVEWWQRPLVAGDAIEFYATKLLIPLSLGPDYGRSPTRAMASGTVFLHCVISIGLIIAAILAWRRKSVLALGFALFFVFLLPVSGLETFSYQSHSTVADHYLYLPIVGIALIAAALMASIPPIAGRPIAFLLSGLLAALTLQQLPIWTNSITLFTRMVQINPRSSGSHNNLGMALLQVYEYPQAEQQFRIAIALNPGDTSAHTNLAMMLLQKGDQTGAIREAGISLAIIQTQPPATRESGEEELAILRMCHVNPDAVLRMAAKPASAPSQP